MSDKKDQKLNLPKTDIPMKANLSQREPEFLNEWSKRDAYGKIRQARRVEKNLSCMMGLLMQMDKYILAMQLIKF